VTYLDSDPAPTIEAHPDGDGTHLDLRLLVAPAEGRFRAVELAGALDEGDLIDHGALIGHVEHAGTRAPVRAFCPGVLVQLLAEGDDQVRLGQPLAWIQPVAR